MNTYIQGVFGPECCRSWFPNIHQMHRSATDVINRRNETMDSKAWVTPSITSVPELFLPRWLEIYLSPVFGSSFICFFFFFFCRHTAATALVICLKWWFILILFYTITRNLQPTRDFFASEVKYFMYIYIYIYMMYLIGTSQGGKTRLTCSKQKSWFWKIPFALCMAGECRLAYRSGWSVGLTHSGRVLPANCKALRLPLT